MIEKIKEANNTNNYKINEYCDLLPTISEQDQTDAGKRISSRAGQRRLREQLHFNAAIQKPVDPDFIDVLIKYGNLSNAVNARDMKAVRLFLNNGADPNERHSLGYAMYEEWGRPIHDVNEGMAPLDIAVRKDDVEMARILLQFGASPEKLRRVDFNQHRRPEYRGNLDEPYLGYISPIYVAIKNKNYELLHLFSEYKADFNKICFRGVGQFDINAGQKPLQIALTEGRDAKVLEILIGGGAKP